MSKVWFLTGASRGFGAAIAQAILASGDRLVATARDRKSLEYLGSSDSLLTLSLDVTNEEDAREAVQAALARFETIDVLVNNAGFGTHGPVEETSASVVEQVFQTNVFGLLHVVRAVVPVMRRQRSRRILNIGSMGGFRAATGFGIYCGTKFAVEALSEALEDELSPFGIHVTVIEPGSFRTDFLTAGSLVSSNYPIDD